MFVTLTTAQGAVVLNLEHLSEIQATPSGVFAYMTNGRGYNLDNEQYGALNDAIAQRHRQEAATRDSLRAIARDKA